MIYGYTLPETNIAPENGWLEDEISFQDGLFSGAMLVSGSVCIYIYCVHGLCVCYKNGPL